MFCDKCGTQMQEGTSFCPACGARFAPAPPMPGRGRVAGHVRTVGILWIVLSLFRLIPGAVLWGLFRYNARFLPPGLPFFIPGLLHALSIVFLAAGLVGIAAGWGLLNREPWARTLAIVLAFLNLLDVPFGTALGIYTLWALLPEQSEREYQGLSERAV